MKLLITLFILIITAVGAQDFGQDSSSAMLALPEAGKFVISEGSSVAYQARTDVLFLFGNTVRGLNQSVNGYVLLPDFQSPNGLQMVLDINAAAFDSKNDRRDNHIREILQTTRFPKIIFTLAEVDSLVPTIGSISESTIHVSGTLQVRDHATPLQFPAQLTATKDTLWIEAEIAVRYDDFGINPPTVAGIVKRAEEHLLLQASLIAGRQKTGNAAPAVTIHQGRRK